jgi:signal transduction histidine kinase
MTNPKSPVDSQQSTVDIGRRVGWFLYAIAWTLAALFYSALLVAQGYTTVGEAIASSIVYMGAAAIAGVGVWLLTARLPIRRLGVIAIHLALAPLYGLFCVGVQYVWLRAVGGSAVSSYVMQMAGVWMFLQSLMLYGIVAGLAYLIRTRRRLRAQQLTAARAEAAAVRAQLLALRSQLNPHFLFNSLHSLSTLVRHDVDAAEEALEQLGSLLRYALDQSANELVPLADEWTFARTYLALEQRRLGNRLRLSAEMSDDALSCLVPPFLLQPLVENAVRHGIAGRPAGGTLSIRATDHNGTLRIEVGDDGAGADPDAIYTSGGVGLRVLREQMRARYGARHELTVRTAPDAGFTVTIALPAERDDAAVREVFPPAPASVAAEHATS